MVVDVIQKMRKELLRRRYSHRTICTYLFCVRRFLNSNHKDVRKYGEKDIREFLERMSEKGASGSTINVYLQALKFMFEYSLNKRFWVDIKYSKNNRKRLPEFLTKEEVVRLFEVIKNSKHSLMIRLMYSAGLRVSELLNLRVRDLEFKQGYGWVRKGKGNKDRVFIIAEGIKKDLFEYVSGTDLDSFIFVGHRGRLSVRTVQMIVDTAARKAKIGKNVHPHTLRHSFATHLISEGYAVNSVQTLLGHTSSDTTMVYVHMKPVSMFEVRSPYDSLGVES